MDSSRSISTLRASTLIGLVTAGSVWGRAELRIGGDGNSWADLASQQGGTYVALDEDGSVLRTVAVDAIESGPVSDAQIRDTGEMLMVDLGGNRLQPVWIDGSQNLARSDERRQVYITTSVGAGQTDAESRTVVPAIDGDSTTAIIKSVPENPRLKGVNSGWVQNMVLTLDAELPVNRVKFFTRPGFEESFLAWYELGGVPDGPIVDRPGLNRPGKRWFQYQSSTLKANNDPAIEIIQRETENLDPIEDVRFPTRDFKWITLRPLDPERDWELAEFEVYGEGYVTRTRYRTDIIDMGRRVTWSRIRWAGQLPERARVVLRTRTGNTPQPFTYTQIDRTGRFAEVDRTSYNNVYAAGSYEKIKKQVDVENWSFWSPAYDWQEGLRDEEVPAGDWTDGTRLLSPSPTRYFQFEIEMRADRDVAPRIDRLEVLFSETSAASQVVGEVWPIETEDFGSQTLTYVVRPVIEPSNSGFDRLEIVTHNRADTVRSVLVDGEEVIDRFPPEVMDDRIVLSFDRLEGVADSEKRIEVVFDVRVLRFGSDFTGFVWSSDDPSVKQRVDPGNATFRFGGDVLSVRTPMGGELISDARIPRVFSPNGDGINDQARIVYDVRDIAAQRSHALEIYDLSGRLVRRLEQQSRSSGTFEHSWNGLDDRGNLVAAGIYLLRIEVDVDEGHDVVTGLLSVAY